MNPPVICNAHSQYDTKGSKYIDHSLMPPCQAACPLHMDIRAYVDLVAQGKVIEAMQVIRDDNPFPSICAYVCNHPCETACRRSQVDKPVAIRALKRFAVEFGADRMVQVEAQTMYPERVAVVGSGPAGMACSYYLRKLGYPVSMFEAHSEVGGMLRMGIPQYRLSHDVLDNEVRRLVQMGVEIRTGTPVVSLDLLFEAGYKAIFVTLGAHQGRKLGVDGEDKPGVVDAVTFLREVNLGLKPVIGEKVVVIGGGNVAIDAARTSLRLGARHVELVCLESRDEMPAFTPDIQDAVNEGVALNCSWGIKLISGDHYVRSVECKKCTSVFDAAHRFNPSFDDRTTTSFEADTIIIAIGQMLLVPDDFHLRLGRGSTIQIDPAMLTTNRAGVFAGGDAVTGPATVVQALAAGRRAASRIDDYLQHRYPQVSENGRESLSGDLSPSVIEVIRKTRRLDPPELPAGERIKDFQPVELVYNWESAANEARRCLRCGIGAEILNRDKCASCLTCLKVCPYHVPYIDTSGTVQIPADLCQACGICVAECPARAIILRKPNDRRQVTEELDHVFRSVSASKTRPFILGFCCQYGLFGTGSLANLWREARAGIWIVPVLCVAKVETEHMLRAFEMGAEGVFIAGCGEQCARENTAEWVYRRIEKVKTSLAQMKLEPACLQAFFPDVEGNNLSGKIETFTQHISSMYLARAITKEVKL